MKRLLTLLALVLGATALLPAAAASAHPLGNFSVNTYAALTAHPGRLDARLAADVAELPTLQDPPATCADAARAFTVTVSGAPVAWTVTASSLTRTPGAGGLPTSRLTCSLTAPAGYGPVTMANRYRDDRIGWREMVAVAGPGVALDGSPLPTAGVSDELRHYPSDLLTSPLDVRTASFTTGPGSGSVAAGPVVESVRPGGTLLGGAERYLEDLAGGKNLTPWVGVLAVVLALLLGAGHAALPGHGKTVMAAYLAGRRGRPRDALAVGATVTLTHTGGVLALGLLLTTVAGVAGETVLGYLGLTSGVVVIVVGAVALAGALRKRGATAHVHHHDHPHDHDHDHNHGHGHDHGHGHGHERSPGPGRWGIVGMGVAGGLVPSPSALIVLLGAAALGRTVFGVLLVLAYGLGMAATLTAAGLLLITIRDRLGGRLPRLRRLRTAAPALTSALILVVGTGLAGRAVLDLL